MAFLASLWPETRGSWAIVRNYSKERVTYAIPVFVILALAIICVAAYQLQFRRCLLWTCASVRSFSISDLTLPASYFPPGAFVGPMAIEPPSESGGAVESGIITVYWDDGKGGAVYNVFRFGTKAQASRFYARYSRLFPYSEHSRLSLASQIANEYQAGCGYSKFGGYRCHLDARYEEFVISLNVTIDVEMTFEQFEKVADYLDEKMWRLLSKEMPDSTPADCPDPVAQLSVAGRPTIEGGDEAVSLIVR